MLNNYYISRKDTITAISTPLGTGAISIIRISGKKSIKIIKKIFTKKKIKYNKVNIGIIYDKKEIIDKVIIIIYKKPNSYTGENLVEINCHGSIYIQKKIINIIIKNGGRLAKNGEFTFRAFINKKIDLLQAESIYDLIKSENKIYHDIAINNLIYKKISNNILKIQNNILDILSYIEIILDFSEEDIKIDKKKIYNKIIYIEKKIKILIESYNVNNIIKEGLKISIIGPVNSGKSTLMNVLIKEDKSIISNIPGTTRDIVEGKIKIYNLNINLFDTAGIRKTNSKIEKIGIKKTFKKIKDTNIILYVFDILKLKNYLKFKKEIKKLKKIIFKKKKVLLIANKIDKYNIIFNKKKIINYSIILISAKKNKGIKKIYKYLYKIIPKKEIKNNNFINNLRHYEELKKSLKYIKKFKKDYLNKIPYEFITIDLKLSLKHLYYINGYNLTYNEVLDNIFSKFCIGK
ncbi:tRNA uridine-5-carboxymethylaminomethyl(34) synthesis GTPase MnmE [Candidatus Shikimatogenerans bostrichidophilus]|uniref:tRNA uridine-5-carboxymethylaminomethyl(34) synthesis GTPase MnmE n=1 Tax=Candidatus Shikimatogenerans bostrichidophilus TaxID=2943807 RepID=UPI002965EE2D